MSSPPQNIGSDAEDGEVSESGDEAVGKDAQDPSNASALPAGQSEEEENGEDSSPQRKVLFPLKCISVYFNPTLCISNYPIPFRHVYFAIWLYCYHTMMHLVVFY